MLGEVIPTDDAGVETARRVWNGAIDKHPVIASRLHNNPFAVGTRFAWPPDS